MFYPNPMRSESGNVDQFQRLHRDRLSAVNGKYPAKGFMRI